MAEFYGNSVFNILRNHQTFPQKLHHLHYYQQCMRVLISPHLHQHFPFFDNNHPNGCEVVSYCDFDLHFLYE